LPHRTDKVPEQVALSARAFRDGKPVDIPVMAMARQIAGERRYRLPRKARSKPTDR